MIILSLYTHHTNSSVSEELMELIPQDNAVVHLVFTVFATYSLTIKLILINLHLLHSIYYIGVHKFHQQFMYP